MRGRSRAQIRALDARVGEEDVVGAFEGDTSRLQDIAAVAQLEGLDHALLDEEDGQPAGLADAVDGLEDLLDAARPEGLRGLGVQQEGGRRRGPPSGAQYK